MTKKQSLLLFLAALPLMAQTPAPAPPMPDVLKNYKTVTAERLAKPEDGDWLMIRRTWNGWGYSPLNQITTANVKQLQPVWVMSTGVTSGHEAPPIVNNGVMFIATPAGQVIAADAKTGAILWRYKHQLPEDLISLHPTSRGIALFGDKLYYAGADAVLIAINVKTGKEIWKTRIADNQSGYYTSLAPIVAGGKVMLGCSGGELGIRGFVAAFDPETGKEVWRTYTVPRPANPAARHGPSAAINGRPAADRFG